MASDDDNLWAAAALLEHGTLRASAVTTSRAGPPYASGLLALREGPALEAAVRALDATPDVVLVNATGRDHPRGAGLALHLGSVLGLPTIGITDRPLVAVADAQPGAQRGSIAALRLDERIVGYVLRTRTSVRPVVVHAAWHTDPDIAREVVLAVTRGTRSRTPEPIRRARKLAREARAGS